MARLSNSDSHHEENTWLNEPGAYHFSIDDAKETLAKKKGTPQIECGCSVLAGTNKSQIGMSHTVWLNLAGNINRTALFLLSTGVITRAQWEQYKAGTDLDFDVADMIGRTFCAEAESDTWEGKTRVEIGFKIWGPLDPDAKHVPKDAEAMKLLEQPAASNGAAGQPTAVHDPWAGVK